MKWFKDELKELQNNHLLRKLTCIESSHRSKVLINGKGFINFSSNDYLDLAAHPMIVKAAANALKRTGFGSGASRLLSGTYDSHRRLEERVAKFKKTETALVFNSGYAANTGVIPVIAGADSVIFSDELNHASIIDGIRLSKATAGIYRHRDTDHLETLLKKSLKKGKIRRRLIITDTVFSMDGDIAPLKDILLLCEKYDSLLMVDDAHGTGVLGETGRGGLEHFHINKTDRVIQMGTLSKALGCFGAFVAGSKDLASLLTSRARSFMYSTSLPPSVAEASVKAIDLVDFKSGLRRKELWKNRRLLHEGLVGLGYDTLDSGTQIIPVFAGDGGRALRIGRRLFTQGIFAPAIRPPTVPEGKCRIRFSLTAAHTKEDIERLLEAMEGLKKIRK
ncbi:MAG: 8-amino-7-oxononanoate synthase [Nitrospirae bacterium]|nr:8-amino-7-oxononanoate synthase [Nitrospirota bacterium]